MELFAEIVKSIADGLIMLLQIAMLLRAVMSWFPGGGGNIIGDVCYIISEPVIAPVRQFLHRFESIRNFPLDLSFFVTFFLISILSTVLF